MKILPLSQTNNAFTTLRSVKLNRIIQKTVSNTNENVKAPLSAIFLTSAGALYRYCSDESDNEGYGDPDWLKQQRQNDDNQRNHGYMGYDTPGLGSGSRETDWN